MLLQVRSTVPYRRIWASMPCRRRTLVSKASSTASYVQQLQQQQQQENLLQQEIRQANLRYEGRVFIRHFDVGWGLEALCHFATGQVVLRAQAVETRAQPSLFTVQVDWDRHVVMDLPARFVNHRCNSANLGVQDNELGAFDFVALRNIAAGDELTWDYEDAEYDMQSPFQCKCDDKHCRELVRGWKYSTDDLDKDAELLPLYRRQSELEERTS